ncbi:MAG: hypothetical protein CO141_03170 [Candidatus Moranbacteria bacterium CG_4_9_14_3_um_filter_42_9]|nr:MAG: hypothetical protein CO141_03170 [Candidatus Moranbacteria bacterium CG_4_9_14_3_um_filter_42_9]
MKKILSNRIFQASLVVAIVFLAGAISVQAKNTNTTINNNIRSSANTSGGNSGENIETGSASAKASVKTETNGTAGETSIQTDVSAEVNGKKVEINTESFGEEDINIQKEVSEDGASASVDVETNQTSEGDDLVGMEDVVTKPTGVVARVTNAIDDALENFFKKIFFLFS